jgi:four helix bundle protein
MRNEVHEKRKALHFRDLLIWQRSMRLTKRLYQLTAGFPTVEKYGLAAQMRRPAVSVPSNIAEGQARRGVKEFGQFLSLAQGSLAELETQVLLSVDLGYSRSVDVAPVTAEIAEVQRMVGAIQRKLTVHLEGSG